MTTNVDFHALSCRELEIDFHLSLITTTHRHSGEPHQKKRFITEEKQFELPSGLALPAFQFPLDFLVDALRFLLFLAQAAHHAGLNGSLPKTSNPFFSFDSRAAGQRLRYFYTRNFRIFRRGDVKSKDGFSSRGMS